MKFDYKIETVPDVTGGYNVPSYTEGMITVMLDGDLFLEADGILLVELAIVLQKWLLRMEQDGITDLYYASMDYEEEPILALAYDAAGQAFRPFAVWSQGAPKAVSVDDAKSAAVSFISRLDSELRKEHNIDLRKVMADSMRATTSVDRS